MIGNILTATYYKLSAAPTNDTFTSLANFPISAADNMGSGIYSGNIYAWGYYNNSGEVFKYSISGNSWTTYLSIMPNGYLPWNFQSLNTDGKIWAIQCGNSSAGGNGNYNLYYNAVSNNYTSLASTPHSGRRGRGSMNAAGTNGYYQEGYTSAPSNLVYNYSVSGNNYTNLANFPQSTYDLGWAHDDTNGNIYAILGAGSGNFSGTYYYYQYSISGNSWTSKNAPTSNNSGNGTTMSGKIYHLGNTSNFMSIYDPTSNSWSYGTHANPCNNNWTASIVNNGTYAYTFGNGSTPTSQYLP